MRIQKYLSQKGVMSRREAENFIRKGLVSVNGAVVKNLATQIDPQKDKVEVMAEGDSAARKVTLAFYKPREIVSSKNPKEGKTVFFAISGSASGGELLQRYKNLNAVGRLDKASEGLLLLSNDGVITSVVTSREHLIDKEYVVTVREKIRPNMIQKLRQGVWLEDGLTAPAQVQKLNDNSFKIVLKEGRKHQIRRMADTQRLTITSLKRMRIGEITLGKLRPGEFRELTKSEVEKIKSFKSLKL